MPWAPELYVVTPDGLLSFPYDDTIGYGDEALADYNYFVIGCRCTKCGVQFLQWGELQEVLREPREMGTEIYYNYSDTFQCSSCQQKQELDFDLTVYAFSWLWEVNSREGLDFVQIEGLEDFLSVFQHELAKADKLERLKGRVNSLKFDREILLENLRKLPSLFLILEGRDDLAIWEQLLRSEGVPTERLAIMKYGSGGVDEAIKLSKVLRSRSLKQIPLLLIIDSDGERRTKIRKLREEQLQDKEFHVLEKKEIESYLINPGAISTIVGVERREAERIIAATNGDGKEKLDAIFRRFGLPAPDEQTKALLARQLRPIPDELRSLIGHMREALSAEVVYTPQDDEEEDDW